MSRTTPTTITITLLALLLAPLFVGGCAGHSPVKVQPTPGTDFSKYQTYAIKPGNVVYPGSPEAERAEMERAVQDAVAAQLEARGLVPQPDAPDLVVTYTLGARSRDGAFGGTSRPPVGVDAREPSGNPYDEPGALRASEWPDAAADAEFRARNVSGNLVIDLLDGRSRRLVWRATADIDLAPGVRGRAIESMVSRSFAELPSLRATATPLRAQTQPVPQTVPATEGAE